ncbi:putative helicase MAGATAMA 3 [Tetrabaena socialis]|uniref:Putative helicase MAGATAMA 3 n=1 Tax=Tetrabaena socialis TaxID=47790 RepID=A0A2J7ZJ54_9CHLO|nr:putative helicase MAGATAMA 3 [Tetrabaena socialis]|eukprot:PNH00302.1 putative helicase MAGATAMA 3 [Tetrabaena socialis]
MGHAELRQLLSSCEALSSAIASLTAEDITRVVEHHWQPGGLAPAAATTAAAAASQKAPVAAGSPMSKGGTGAAVDGGEANEAVGMHPLIDAMLAMRGVLRGVSSNGGLVQLVVREGERLLEFRREEEWHDTLIKYCLRSARVVFATVAALGGFRARALNHVEACVMDEAAQLPEADMAIPLARFPALRLMVLVGDPKQLPANIQSRASIRKGYGRSVFERLQCCGHSAMLLNTQYRMHPAISAWPKDHFYRDKVVDGGIVCGPSYDGVAELLGMPRGPYLVIDVGNGREELRESTRDDSDELAEGVEDVEYAVNGRSRVGGKANAVISVSWRNHHEAAAAAMLTQRVVDAWKGLRSGGARGGAAQPGSAAAQALLQQGRELSIGIITPYTAQVEAIVERVAQLKKGMAAAAVSIAVRSVDGFQGQEKDVVVVSLVRANETGAVGFLEDPRRLNVGTTRARHVLVMLVNAQTLQRCKLYACFLDDARKRGLLVSAEQAGLLLDDAAVMRAQGPTRQHVAWGHAPRWNAGFKKELSGKPWKVLHDEASLMRLDPQCRDAVERKILWLAGGGFACRLKNPKRDLVHVEVVVRGQLMLLWRVRLSAAYGERDWGQVLQVLDVVQPGSLLNGTRFVQPRWGRDDERALDERRRRLQAECRSYTPEHLDAVRG